MSYAIQPLHYAEVESYNLLLLNYFHFTAVLISIWCRPRFELVSPRPLAHKGRPAHTEAGPEGSASCFRKTVSYFVSYSVSYSILYSVRESMMGLMMPSITV